MCSFWYLTISMKPSQMFTCRTTLNKRLNLSRNALQSINSIFSTVNLCTALYRFTILLCTIHTLTSLGHYNLYFHLKCVLIHLIINKLVKSECLLSDSWHKTFTELNVVNNIFNWNRISHSWAFINNDLFFIKFLSISMFYFLYWKAGDIRYKLIWIAIGRLGFSLWPQYS